MSMSTAAISSRASVAGLNPPVSTSTTTGRKPRKRRAMPAAADSSTACHRRIGEAPCDRLAGAIGHEFIRSKGNAFRRPPLAPFERDALFVLRPAVELRAEFARKSLEAAELTRRIEDFRIQLDRGVRREHAGATAGRLLRIARV